MATDTTQLLRRLQEYERTLTRHLDRTSREWSQMERSLQQLRGVYEGTAARDFLSHWDQSKQAFKAYNEGGKQVLRLLRERIAALHEADKRGNL